MSTYSHERYLANREKVIAATRAYRAANLEKCKARDRAYNAKHAEKKREYAREHRKQNKEALRAASRVKRETRVVSSLIKHAKYSAKKRGVPFDLVESYVHVPEFCPVLGLRLAVAAGKRNAASPSLDRIIPAKGYVRENVRVISWRANNIKTDASLAELRQVVAYMESLGVDRNEQ